MQGVTFSNYNMLIPFSDLFKKYKVDATGVLHVGASHGQEIKEYYRNGIQRSIWVECLPDIFKQLKKNIASYPNAIALEACIGEKNGETVVFNVANNEGQSSSYLEFGTHAIEHPTVRFVDQIEMTTVRLDTLLALDGIDLKDYTFLNIDLQGAELFALKSLGEELHKIRYAYIEVNERELYKGCPLIDNITDYMKKFGFALAEKKITNWGWGDALYISRFFNL